MSDIKNGSLDPSEITVQAVQERIGKGPFHKWLGLEVVAVGPDTIELTFRWREEWMVRSEDDDTHGGILATIVDLTADWSLVSRTGHAVPTVDLRVDFHRAARRGDLRSVGKLIKFGRRTSVAEAEVFGPDDELVASGRGVYLTAVVS
jgi:uncharacterized protein (TIGR00369 family)